MSRFFRRLALLAKVETTYGTDSVPVAATDGVLASNVSITPTKAAETDQRDVYRGVDGSQGMFASMFHAEISFSVELAGGGSPLGTAPRYGALLRGCGMNQVIVATTSVTYNPVSVNRESLSLYFFLDGVQHRLLGARGTWTLDFDAGKLPRLKFKFTGLLGTESDVAFPSNVAYTAFQVPRPANPLNTTFAFHGITAGIHHVDIDFGNEVGLYKPITGLEVEITGRSVAGNIHLEAVGVAAKDWNAIFRNRTRGTLQIVHGVGGGAGQIVTINAGQVEIGEREIDVVESVVVEKIPFMCCLNAGDDEMSIVCT